MKVDVLAMVSFTIKYFHIHFPQLNLFTFYELVPARGSVVVKALSCKPEGRGFKF
jgi:hypothetical protein